MSSSILALAICGSPMPTKAGFRVSAQSLTSLSRFTGLSPRRASSRSSPMGSRSQTASSSLRISRRYMFPTLEESSGAATERDLLPFTPSTSTTRGSSAAGERSHSPTMEFQTVCIRTPRGTCGLRQGMAFTSGIRRACCWARFSWESTATTLRLLQARSLSSPTTGFGWLKMSKPEVGRSVKTLESVAKSIECLIQTLQQLKPADEVHSRVSFGMC